MPDAERTVERRARAQIVMSSSSSVTSAAIGERSERVRVTWANSGCPLSVSIDRDDAVVAADPQVVALRDVVGQHDPRVLPDPATAP